MASTIRAYFANESPRAKGVTNSRLSAEVWYSGNSAYGVRIRDPTGKSNPGEQNCRSSLPQGKKSTIRKGSPLSRSTSSTILSIRDGDRLFLYVEVPGSPTQVATRPCRTLETHDGFAASQAIAPIVSGMNRKR